MFTSFARVVPNIVSCYSAKPITHFTMQVKIRVSIDPVAEEISMKSNEVFKIPMAIAAFQVHCTELLNNEKKFSSFLKRSLGQED